MTVADLIEPAAGGLSESLFPATEAEEEDGVTDRSKLESLVTAWLQAARREATDEQAQRHWVRHQAFRLKSEKLIEGPMLAEAGEDRVQFLISQSDRYASKAADELAAFEDRVRSLTAEAPADEPWAIARTLR